VAIQPLSDTLKELTQETVIDVHAGALRSRMLSVTAAPGLCFSSGGFTETLPSGSSPSGEENSVEDFTAVSLEHVESSYEEKLSAMRHDERVNAWAPVSQLSPLPHFSRYSDSTRREPW